MRAKKEFLMRKETELAFKYQEKFINILGKTI